MNVERGKLDRRNFLKTIGASGLGVVLAAGKLKADVNEPNKPKKEKEEKFTQVPKRILGKTGVEVPVLSLGIMYNAIDKQIILKKAVDWGVTFWDTSYGYAGGNSEIGIGNFIAKNQDIRKDLFIVSKASGAKSVADVENRLQESLKRMNTNYIDLYYGVHGLDDPANLTSELKQWAADAKKRKLIKFFGFSTHTNMAKCLAGAAKLDWIDAIMPSYNFRLMQDAEMQDAVEACSKANIGLIAMKIQGHKVETEGDKKLADHFIKSGFTEGQAKIKIVLEDKRIAVACVGGDNITHLTMNIAAVLDRTQLTMADKDIFKDYAQATCSGYCAGCSNICDLAMADKLYINEVMRSLMYYNSYGLHDQARQTFAQIPSEARNRLLNIDYTAAEHRCPQHLPIARLVTEAVSKLA
jgi:predicted aldo/keto reductase-like oxidoreductase